ncbi:MAG TPA: hypothetical protein VFD09_10255 [Thiopseudomonas sp.]|nr:hypothetical protein [Thiopseudomonas sp.]
MLGEISDTLRIGEWDIDLVVRHALENRQSLDCLQDLAIRLPDNSRVPLNVAVDIEQARDWAVITRKTAAQACRFRPLPGKPVVTAYGPF